MERAIYRPTPELRPITSVVDLAHGGTGATDANIAVSNLGGISTSLIGQHNGLAQGNESGKVKPEELPSVIPYGVTVDGLTSLTVNTVSSYLITNYDNAATYSLTAITGTVTRVNDTITYTAPADVGAGGFIVNNKRVDITIVASAHRPAAPTWVYPTNNSTTPDGGFMVQVDAFSMVSGDMDTHDETNWILAADPGFTYILQDAITPDPYLTQAPVPSLPPTTDFYVKARFHGATTGWGDFSEVCHFTTDVAQQVQGHTETYRLISPETSAYAFGLCVKMSGDKSKIFCSGQQITFDQNSNRLSLNRIYVFIKSGSSWVLDSTIDDPKGVQGGNNVFNADFGNIFVVNYDGTEIFVSDDQADVDVNTTAGVVYNFTFANSIWTQTSFLITAPVPTSNQSFGKILAMSRDGTRLVVGGGQNYNDFLIYLETSGVWALETTITKPVDASTDFGTSSFMAIAMSINADGSKLAIGDHSWYDTGTSTTIGSVYIYTRVDTTWSLSTTLVCSSPEALSNFGSVVQFVADGTRLLVCATDANADHNGGVVNSSKGVGSAFIYVYANSTWVQEGQFDAPQDTLYYGVGLAITDDGLTTAIGAAFNKYSLMGGGWDGSIDLCSRTVNTWSKYDTLLQSVNPHYTLFGVAINLSGDGLLLATGAPYEGYNPMGGNPGTPSGVMYIFDL